MLISFLLLGYNSSHTLPPLFDSLRSQTCQDYEVVALDNASADDTASVLEGTPNLSHLAVSPHNLGYAAGMNQLVARSAGSIVVPLNADVILDDRFVENLLRSFECGHDVVSPLVYSGEGTDGRIDGAKIGISLDMRSVHFLPSAPVRPLKQTGPCPAFSRDLIDRLGRGRGNPIFDDVLFDTYGEDIDLALRVAREGVPVHFDESVVAFHSRSSSTGEARAIFKTGRVRQNIIAARYLNSLLHLTRGRLIAIVPLLLAQDVAVVLLRSRGGDRSVIRDVLGAWKQVLQKLGRTLRARRAAPPDPRVNSLLKLPRFRLRQA
ncbi:glycosyltransferase [Nocardioides sp. dk4132]|uniref:glycosyltransferase family 2 protein n=1 Tax=unclassified Nocardioides TaxID=2615069 RepID=UPI001295211E|nr:MULTISPECIES: glycosyltransferase family 2 protein [unclassified Nocardioides]MQW78100.1 glycosyltransferase [Nocardioides sp. dk4132]QGA09074.1 glycosyltransferase [Nocardioides sp. dk884]